VKHRGAWPSDVSRETADKLDRLHDLILNWNRTINLISRADEPRLRERHFADSLNLIPYLPADLDGAIDLGSGAGFPGIVLALATGHRFELVEADKRKAAFLREAARLTEAPVRVHAQRIETLSLRPATLITARALAPLATLLEWTEPLLAPDGVCVFPKGKSADGELTDAARQWHMRVEQWPSPLDPSARILRLSEITRV
jgi:16S rRNA (guanine527-N7)-methyltransferase